MMNMVYIWVERDIIKCLGLVKGDARLDRVCREELYLYELRIVIILQPYWVIQL